MSGIEFDWERFAETWRSAQCVRSSQVGPVMAPSQEHLLCEEFAELHPDGTDFLFAKLRDSDPCLAAYAFKCLLRVGDIQMEDIPRDVLERSDPIQTLFGCVVRTTTLGSFIRGYWGFEDPEPAPIRPKRYLP